LEPCFSHFLCSPAEAYLPLPSPIARVGVRGGSMVKTQRYFGQRVMVGGTLNGWDGPPASVFSFTIHLSSLDHIIKFQTAFLPLRGLIGLSSFEPQGPFRSPDKRIHGLEEK